MSIQATLLSPEYAPEIKLDVSEQETPLEEQADSKTPSQDSTEISEITPWATTSSAVADVSHQIISAHFIGPQAENLSYFKDNINIILDELKSARTSYYPGDGKFISEDMQKTAGFKDSMKKLENAVRMASRLLGQHSIPFWSPRYEAHMCTDLSMASVLGYFMTMLYNPNNVALEASPLSTIAEIEVGEQLCELFGYNIDEDDQDSPTGWGHVTCDGTVANLESIWVARNLKYYPLSIRQAMEKDATGKDGPLKFLAERFYIDNCQGVRTLFSKLTKWELLNLKAHDILDIPDRLYQEHGISNTWLSEVMNKYTVQSTGKEALERLYTPDKPAQLMLATTRHYSWPKGAAISGLGSDNVVGIAVDNAARLDINALEARLQHNLDENIPVFAVVAIIGSTEEGAVDSLSSILALRKQFQAKGLSFLVHGDAAWGGYFCSMLPKNYRPGEIINLPTEMGEADGFVPDASLRAETQEDLYALRFADSITVDPHKAGYIPYPAGGLCYRDGRMRFLVTWTSPYLSRGSVTSIGIYGVEGSKPGASAVSTWLSNKTIGLTQEGYGSLLGEVTWTCTRLSAEWAALTDASSPYICMPLNEMPSELDPNSTPEKIQAEKDRIRKDILAKTNAEIVREDSHRPHDQKVMKLLRDLGSDLNINAFALNFRYSNGDLNDDVEEANYLMQRVIEALSVDSPDDDPTKIPLYLTSTEFSDELYGKCKEHFMNRLGLKQSKQDLMVLRNVVMSPFPTDGNFISKLAGIFDETVRRETEIVRKRNEVGEEFHSFLLQGTDQLHLVHLPMFHVANHRQQLIFAIEFDKSDEKTKEKYISMRQSNPTEPMILVTQRKMFLPDVIKNKTTFLAQIKTEESGIILKNITVNILDIVVSRPLNSQWRLDDYPPDYMAFYLYGNDEEASIDHVIVKAPNTQLSASGCKLSLDTPVDWSADLVLVLNEVYEAPMQPFPSNIEIGSKNGAIISHHHLGAPGEEGSGSVVTSETRSGRMRGSAFFFRPGAKFKVSVHLDGDRNNNDSRNATFKLGPKVGEGEIVLGDNVFVDSEAMNFDPFKTPERVSQWRREFDEIGKALN